MKNLFITYCSRNKSRDAGDLPALERYLCDRIRAVHSAAVDQGADFRILSGKFGLLAADEVVPWYDHLLTEGEVTDHIELVLPQLREIGPERIFLFMRSITIDPCLAAYAETIARTCVKAGIDLAVIEIDEADLSVGSLARKLHDLSTYWEEDIAGEI